MAVKRNLRIVAACACLSVTAVLARADAAHLGKMRAGKILFLGNSITTCGPKYWGLAASTAEKDYAHLLAAAISAKTGSRLTMIPTAAPVARPDGSVDVGQSNVIVHL